MLPRPRRGFSEGDTEAKPRGACMEGLRKGCTLDGWDTVGWGGCSEVGRGGAGGQAPGTGASAGGVRAMPQLEEGCPAPPSMGRTPEGQGLGRSLGLEACSEHGALRLVPQPTSDWGGGAAAGRGSPPPTSCIPLPTGPADRRALPGAQPQAQPHRVPGLREGASVPGRRSWLSHAGSGAGPTPPSAGQLSALPPDKPAAQPPEGRCLLG